MLNKQTQDLKARIHDQMKDFDRDDNDDFRAYLSEEVDRAKYPNQHVLEDVRPYPQDNSDFSFREGDDEEEEREAENVIEDENVDHVDDPRPQENGYNADEYGETDGYRKGSFYDVKLSDPTNFAYSPSDPRFYEDLHPGIYFL